MPNSLAKGKTCRVQQQPQSSAWRGGITCHGMATAGGVNSGSSYPCVGRRYGYGNGRDVSPAANISLRALRHGPMPRFTDGWKTQKGIGRKGVINDWR